MAGLTHRDFTVLSNDCWGEALYRHWGLPCRTPFRGAGMEAGSFVRFLSDYERYLRQPLRFTSGSMLEAANRVRNARGGWPIGLLGDDVEVHFLHYRSEAEALHAWQEGCRAVNFKRIVVKFSVDKDGARDEHVREFARLPITHKLLLSRRAYPQIPCAVRVSPYVTDGGMMFHRSLRHFDCAHWINTGEVRRYTPTVVLNKLIYMRGV